MNPRDIAAGNAEVEEVEEWLRQTSKHLPVSHVSSAHQPSLHRVARLTLHVQGETETMTSDSSMSTHWQFCRPVTRVTFDTEKRLTRSLAKRSGVIVEMIIYAYDWCDMYVTVQNVFILPEHQSVPMHEDGPILKVWRGNPRGTVSCCRFPGIATTAAKHGNSISRRQKNSPDRAGMSRFACFVFYWDMLFTTELVTRTASSLGEPITFV